ncbi:MAG: lipoate--protein ligase family protein [Chlamydiales bacterium]
MHWRCLDTGIRNAAANMALDSALLADAEYEREATLHFYEWEREAATFGYFIDPKKFLNLEEIVNKKIDLAKRPTGGGIIFHNCDLAFSIIVPASHPAFSNNSLENYAFVNRRVVEIITSMTDLSTHLFVENLEPFDNDCKSFCMAMPTKYDVMIQGKKVGGAAQRKTKYGYLHQGSIAIGSPSEGDLCQVLNQKTKVFDAIRANSFSFLGENWTRKELEEIRSELRIHLKKRFMAEDL